MGIAAALQIKGEVAIFISPQVEIRPRERGRVSVWGPGAAASEAGCHPVFSPKKAKSDASVSFSASAGSKPRHLRPLFRMSLAPSAMA